MNIKEPKTPEEQELLVTEALTRAEEHRKRGEFNDGIHLLVEALKYGIKKEAIYFRLGNIYIDAGDLSRAEYAYKRALEVDPHHVNAMHNLSVVYKRQGKISLFVKTYKKAQRMELRHPRKVSLSPEERKHLRLLGIRWGVTAILVLAALLAIIRWILR